MEEENHTTSCPVYLPRSIASSHTICTNNVDQENNLPSSVNEKFILGKMHFDNEEYKKARQIFENCCSSSVPAKYRLAVMMYDGLGGEECTTKALQLMKEIVEDAKHAELVPCAQYNIGRAYYEGIGMKQSDSEAEKWWLLSARDGEPDGCVKAQSILAMFYSCKGEKNFDVSKAHFWHQEATGNGSLESQGALGVMYEHGIGVVKDAETSFKCFKSAAERGNVYAMGNLAVYYYRNKMFNNASDVARRVGSLQDTAQLSRETNCLERYIKKGIALGCFIYGRCLDQGVVEKKDDQEAFRWYTQATKFDLDTTQQMQNYMMHGKI